MKLFKKAEDLQNHLSKIKADGLISGFVPTMGALHEGHVSLLRMSKEKCDVTICSIFVNPTQFNDKIDFEQYPITLGNDILMLENAGCDILFLPELMEIYPNGLQDLTVYDLGALETMFEGKFRPGHFQGVCQVVHRLLHFVQPDFLFLGQKDYQQCMVLKSLVKLINSKVEVIVGATYREKNGLAMSSRNQRLTVEQRSNAVAIYTMLSFINDNLKLYDINYLLHYAEHYLLTNGFSKVDYIAIAEVDTLKPLTGIIEGSAVVLIAAFMGNVRLIDNMVIHN